MDNALCLAVDQALAKLCEKVFKPLAVLHWEGTFHGIQFPDRARQPISARQEPFSCGVCTDDVFLCLDALAVLHNMHQQWLCLWIRLILMANDVMRERAI